MSRRPDWDEFPKLQAVDPEALRAQQGRLVEEAVLAAESGRHVHYHGGGTVWCNTDPTCSEARPVSELLS